MKICDIKVEISSPNKPPFFMGVALRTAFGKALKSVSCINHIYKCEGCFAAADCLYHKLYEGKNEYKKFRFDFELGQKTYGFGVILFDEICDELAYIASALQIMLTKNGIGKERIKDEKFKLFVNDQECRKNGLIKLPENFIKTLDFSAGEQNIKIYFLTPIRIKKDNEFAKNLDISDILNSIRKRKNSLFGMTEESEKCQDLKCKSELKFVWVSGNSKNAKQKNAMKLGGLVGNMHVYGLDGESFKLLKIGEIIGVGKQSVYGLGKIKVECENE